MIRKLMLLMALSYSCSAFAVEPCQAVMNFVNLTKIQGFFFGNDQDPVGITRIDIPVKANEARSEIWESAFCKSYSNPDNYKFRNLIKMTFYNEFPTSLQVNCSLPANVSLKSAVMTATLTKNDKGSVECVVTRNE